MSLAVIARTFTMQILLPREMHILINYTGILDRTKLSRCPCYSR